MEREANSRRRGEEELGFENQGGSNAPQNVRWAMGNQGYGQDDPRATQNANHAHAAQVGAGSSQRARSGDEFVTHVGAVGGEGTSRAQEDGDVADRAGG